MKSHRLNRGELELLIKLLSNEAEQRKANGIAPAITNAMVTACAKLMRQLELLE